ncbi:phosphomevalonate kinase [Clostridium manihotivorum]|uniref:phosphomevalonate kinase n=1 Tax=Clostridium manihotivorum TaxID=2320868 RepID=A0A3R5U8H8_9CLOT|nr:phosphomevalonate kinase [Clostridium manihotivorum]QAA31808.1 phosphomevalonate kinase [Clostridium manihotivorum]
MDYSSYNVKVPGKLMIAGEYAVLEPNQKAIVVAVNRYVNIHIEPSKKNELFLPQLGLENIAWEIIDEKVKFSVGDARLNFIENSIAVANQYLKENFIEIRPFRLLVNSELDDTTTGEKYGLGSSAAIVVSVISAILSIHWISKDKPSLEQIFKLSAIAHLRTQKSGSGADIAASVYGGWLEYSSFSSKWVIYELRQNKSIIDIINQKWPNLSIKKLLPPPELQLAVGWTKSPISTAPMIKSVHNFKQNNTEKYNYFLRESLHAVEAMIDGFERNDCNKAIKSLNQNRKALQSLEEASSITIETETLKRLCSIAERFGSGKSSGAGGGDCGIAFLEGSNNKKELYEAWKHNDIKPLNLEVAKVGVSVESIS